MLQESNEECFQKFGAGALCDYDEHGNLVGYPVQDNVGDLTNMNVGRGQGNISDFLSLSSMWLICLIFMFALAVYVWNRAKK